MARCQVGYFRVFRELVPSNPKSPFRGKPRTYLVYQTLCNWAAISDSKQVMEFGDQIKQGEVCCTKEQVAYELLKSYGMKSEIQVIRRDLEFLCKIGLIKKVSNYKPGTMLPAIYFVVPILKTNENDPAKPSEETKKDEREPKSCTDGVPMVEQSCTDGRYNQPSDLINESTDGVPMVEQSCTDGRTELYRLLRKEKEELIFKEGRGRENEPIPEPVYDEHPEIIQISDPPSKPIPSEKEIILNEDEEWLLKTWENEIRRKYGGEYTYPRERYGLIRQLVAMAQFGGFTAKENIAAMAMLYLKTDSDFYIDRKHDFEWLINDFSKLQKMVYKFRREGKIVNPQNRRF